MRKSLTSYRKTGQLVEGEGWEEIVHRIKARGHLHAKGYSRSFIGEEIQIWMLSLLSCVRIETWKRGGFIFWKGDWVERTRVRALHCPKAAKSKCRGKHRSTDQCQHKVPAPWTDPHKHILGTHLKTLNPRSIPNASCLKKPCPAPTAESKEDGVRNTEVMASRQEVGTGLWTVNWPWIQCTAEEDLELLILLSAGITDVCGHTCLM